MNLPPPRTATRQGGLQRLTERAALWFEREACLTVRFPYVGCDRCAHACPVEVLTLSGDGPELAEGCLTCGRCVAACPTDALRMPGSRLEAPEPEKPVQLDCQRVPAALCPDNTLRPPCLGAVRTSELLALAQGGSSVTLLDRGWCGNCPAGGERHPAAAAVAETRRWLRDARPDAESASRTLEIVLLIAALGALGTQGLVYGMMGMRPFWFSATLPLYFLAGALVVGLALVILLTNLAHDLNRDKMPEPTRQLMDSTLPNVLLVVLALYILTTIGRVVTGLWSNLDGHQVVYVNMMNSTLFHLEFFGGLLLPFVLLALPGLRTNPLVQVLASLLLVIALFIGRYEFTIGGQLVPLFKGNWIPGLIQYTPSTVEWMLTLTTVSVALLVYAIAEKLFNPPRA